MNRDRRTRPRVVVYRAKLPDSDKLHEVEYPAVADALHFACRDLREGRRIPLEILEDGVPVLDAAAIAAECQTRAEEMAREHGLGDAAESVE